MWRYFFKKYLFFPPVFSYLPFERIRFQFFNSPPPSSFFPISRCFVYSRFWFCFYFWFLYLNRNISFKCFCQHFLKYFEIQAIGVARTTAYPPLNENQKIIIVQGRWNSGHCSPQESVSSLLISLYSQSSKSDYLICAAGHYVRRVINALDAPALVTGTPLRKKWRFCRK